MIDVVYILGKGSGWSDNELKYSLRSIEKYLTNFNNVFIIGHKPAFLNEKAIHIPYSDIYPNKARNIMAKCYRASMDERITPEFLLMNDDYFLMQKVNAPTYPYYFKCDLNHTINIQNNEYKLHVIPTRDILTATGRNILNFDVHYPTRYNKAMFIEMADSYDWNRSHGYIVKSMYCNHHRISGVHRLDCKVNHPMPKDHIPGFLAGKEMFSTGENAMNAHMRDFIVKTYPEKSSFEK